MKRLILFFFIFTFCSQFLAAKSKEEIISKVYKAAEMQSINPDSALQLGYEILKESEAINYTEGKGYAYIRISSILNLKGKNDSALIYAKKAYLIRNQLGDISGAAAAKCLMGYIYEETGRIDSAFAAFYFSIRLLEEEKDTTQLLETYLELAHLLCDYNELGKAKLYYDKSLALAIETNDVLSKAYCYEGYAKFYLRKLDYKKTLNYYFEAAKIHRELNNTFELAVIYSNIAVCYDNVSNYKLAISFYHESLKIYQQMNLTSSISLAYFNLGVSFYNLKELDSSVFYLSNSMEFANLIGDINRQSKIKKQLSSIYFSKGDHLLAYQSFREYSRLNDSLINLNKVASIAEMQTKYETEKKEQKIVLLDEQNKTQEAQRNLLFAIAASLLLGIVTLSFLYIQRKKIAKKNELIAEQKIESLLDEQDIKTYNALLEGQEEERMRIATDLHDRLGGILSTIKLLFSALDDKIDKSQKQSKVQYEKANYLLDEACVEVRRVSHNLGTGMVANFGLYRALEELCESIHDSGKIKCSLLAFGLEESPVKLKIEVGIYRMVQEVFNNSLKYAKAKNLTLQINRNEDDITIMIEDDGIGFDLQKAKMKDGMGLNNIEMRAIKLKGTLHIDTKIGRGVTTIIEIPLNSLS